MFKKLGFFAILLMLAVSCSRDGAQNGTVESVNLSVEEVAAQAENYVEKSVAVSGTVVHVCRHGGKKMFMIGEDPDTKFKVTANAAVGSFDVALEGSKVTVKGLVQAEVVEVEVEKEHKHTEAAAEGEEKECEFEQVTYYSLDCISVTEI